MALHNVEPPLPESPDHLTGRGDPQQRLRIYRLCVCFQCLGEGKSAGYGSKDPGVRCPGCRGEGRVLDLVATCADAPALGTALVQLAEEGEFDDCPLGVLVDGGSWLIKPWLPSPRNVTDAARLLAQSRTKGE